MRSIKQILTITPNQIDSLIRPLLHYRIIQKRTSSEKNPHYRLLRVCVTIIWPKMYQEKSKNMINRTIRRSTEPIRCECRIGGRRLDSCERLRLWGTGARRVLLAKFRYVKNINYFIRDQQWLLIDPGIQMQSFSTVMYKKITKHGRCQSRCLRLLC